MYETMVTTTCAYVQCHMPMYGSQVVKGSSVHLHLHPYLHPITEHKNVTWVAEAPQQEPHQPDDNSAQRTHTWLSALGGDTTPHTPHTRYPTPHTHWAHTPLNTCSFSRPVCVAISSSFDKMATYGMAV